MRTSDNNHVLSAILLFSRNKTFLQKECFPALELEEEVIIEGSLDESIITSELRMNSHINNLWWHFAKTDFSSDVTSPCGCKTELQS
jgi:hypothetical protein